MQTEPTSPRSARLHAALMRAFTPAVLEIQDDSAHHAGHSGAQPGGQTHFAVLLVSDAFRGVSRVSRERAVHAAALYVMGLIDEASHVLMARYREEFDPEVMTSALG